VGEPSENANPTYRLAAAGREAAEDERLSLLESIFDPTSRRRRSLVKPGWRCLEIGAGRGSMAVWLAQQVGEKGQVVATDLDVTYLERLHLPNLDVRRHDILEDSIETLGPGSFDMVSLRLVLFCWWTVKRRQFGASCNASDREDGSLMKTEIGAPSYQSIHFILCPSVTNKSGRKASGGLLADTTPNLDGSSRCCSSAAAYGTSGTKRALKC
jgi:SAM-dependent methyltransferase